MLHSIGGIRQQPLMFDPTIHGGGKRLPGTKETVALLAGLMALNAFAIDAMIPALEQIGRDLGVADANERQLVVICYFSDSASLN
jgi:DHA1 family bicyclomycin/chloramphenicol resistance-like MFS transporter